MKRMIKRLSLLLVFVLLTLGLAACGAKTPEKAPAAGALAVTAPSETVSEADTAQTEKPSETEAAGSEAAGTDAAEPETAETAESEPAAAGETETAVEDTLPVLDEEGSYNTKEEVALYIHLYGKLPSNYLTKKEAQKLGWSGGSLEKYAPGKSIGGSYFGNNEGILPKGKYTECDIDTVGKKSRGAKRIVFSDKGEVYYTEDHYETFTLLYTADGPVKEEVVYGD